MTFAITLAAFLMTACDDEPDYRNYTTPTLPPTYPMVIRSMFPSAGAPGSTVAILGENFGESAEENYVAFGSTYADILYVTYGVINVRVPMGIPDGDYRINISCNGQSAEAPSVFRVTSDTVLTPQ
ncbi:MAG TPA: IPT/TIG domain-containing protein [Saprospiraceae bacterium]|nr:IPT/TIG domain-containing protein [Saprospiraceae bacterium]